MMEEDIEKQNTEHEVKRFMKGEADAIALLYEKHSKHIMQYLKNLLTYACDAEDLTQDVFEIAMMNCTKLRDENKFQAWLRGIAYKLAMRKILIRNRECMIGTIEQCETTLAFLNTGTVLEEKVIYNEFQNEVLQMIEKLPEEQKKVLIAYYYQGKPLEQIAEQQKCPLGTVKTRLRIAKENIKSNHKDCIEMWID